MSVQLIIVAAGVGARMGAPVPKALLDVAGTPLLVRTLSQLLGSGLFDLPPIVTYPASHQAEFETCLESTGIAARLIPGGAERQDSVRLALAATPEAAEVVAIHDAARPFVPAGSVRASIEAARECGAATVAIPVTDTILEADADGYLMSTPERARLWACQTPQTFLRDAIVDAHARALAEGYLGTDDASLVRRYGGKVRLVQGHPFNIKITRPEDLPLAQRIIEEDAWRTA